MKRITFKNTFLFCLFLMAFCFVNQGAVAQGPQKGMLRSQGTLGLGFDTYNSDLRYYLYGELEYLVSDHLGFNGAIVAQVGSQKKEYPYPQVDNSPFENTVDQSNYFIFWGPVAHLNPGSRVDFFVGAQPGFFVSHIPAVTAQETPAEYYHAPQTNIVGSAISVNPGVAVYGSFFHVFANVRMVAGKAASIDYSVKVREIIPSFGLGFNIGG